MIDTFKATLVLPVGKHVHVQGLSSAVVTLVEYDDYQCRFCGDIHPIIRKLQRVVVIK